MTGARTFRIFVSSTFNDLKAERNALQRDCFTRLRHLCAEHGARFQAIDLRWGVPSEAGLDQRTMSICLEEIGRCREVSPRPNFLVLLGDRYGWRPLPETVPADTFSEIAGAVADEADRADFEEWYVRDDNAVPPEYRLRPRTGDSADDAAWSVMETRLRDTLTRALDRLGGSEEERRPLESSATEREIERGALTVEDAKDHVFCFFRSIDDLPADVSAGEFRDLAPDGRPDDEAAHRLERLKARLAGAGESPGALPPANVMTYRVPWPALASGDVEELEPYLKTLGNDVYSALERVILEELDRLEALDPVAREMAEHRAFGEERRRCFTGRTSILKHIHDYLDSAAEHPLAVHGASGSGKSAVVARAAAEAEADHPAATVVTRFIGATPASSDIRSLLEGLCRELARAYGADEAETPSDYRELVRHFGARLEQASAEQPLVLFLDALDQLSDADGGRTLAWLPPHLPDHVHVVTSALAGDALEALARKLPEASRVELTAMPASEAGELLDLWLDAAARTLQPDQRDAVLAGFASCPYPLWLRLAFEEARRWHSYTPPGDTELVSDIPGLVGQLFDRLASESQHGPVLTRHALGYMAAARNGLTEDEVLDLLSLDEEVRESFLRRSHHTPPERRLPVAVWSRFYMDLEPYLTERSADGTSLLGFYHRQLREVAEERYLTDDRFSRHAALADYFDGQPLFLDGDRKRETSAGIEVDHTRIANLRKLAELPFQQTRAAAASPDAERDGWKRLYETLTDFDFMEAKCSYVDVSTQGSGEAARRVYGGVYDLQEDFRRALEVFPANLEWEAARPE